MFALKDEKTCRVRPIRQAKPNRLKKTGLLFALVWGLTIVSMSSAGVSQNSVSLNLKNAPLRTALDLLTEKTDFDVVYDGERLDDIKVSCQVEQVPLYVALQRLLAKTSIAFQIFREHKIILLQDLHSGKQKKVAIYGRVLEDESGDPLADVNVFLANTLMGAATNSQGFFVIPKVPRGTFKLVASRIGYGVKLLQLRVEESNEPLIIHLTPKPYQAPEIEVSARALREWQKHLAKFTELLFSTTQNAAQCEILNPTVLEFKKKNGVFFATAHEPLVIENRALGYKLRYVMEFFSASRTIIRVRGFTHFEELEPHSPEETELWQRNRLRAYHGSLKHFLATLCRSGERLVMLPEGEVMVNNPFLNQSGFRLFLAEDPWRDDLKIAVHDADFLLQPTRQEHQKWLRFPAFLMVHYTEEGADENYRDFGSRSGFPNQQVSLITLIADSVVIDTYGNVYDSHGLRVDGFGLRTYGYWSWERMADRLPWDYLQPSDVIATNIPESKRELDAEVELSARPDLEPVRPLLPKLRAPQTVGQKTDQSRAKISEVACETCSGTGTIATRYKCIKCNGRGKLHDECPKCSGTGHEGCRTCGGSGVINVDARPAMCPECRGVGKVLCVWCRGTGIMYSSECDVCSGTGVIAEDIPCKDCDGDGRSQALAPQNEEKAGTN